MNRSNRGGEKSRRVWFGWMTLCWCVLWASCGDGVISEVPADHVPKVLAPAPPFAPGASRLKRLTRAQYENVVRDLFGDALLINGALEPDVSVSGFLSVGAGTGSLSERGTEQYESMAYAIVEQVMAPGAIRDEVVFCKPLGPVDDVCARKVLRRVGRRAYRRALTTTEEDALVGLARQGATALNNFYEGLGYALAGVLQSPNFLFRAEFGEEDPSTDMPSTDNNVLRYSSMEMASRLSFFLWSTIPDEELLQAAESGALVDDEALRVQVERMLEDPRARNAVRAFFSELLELHRLDDLVKDPNIFVHISPEVGPSAREETLMGLEHLIFDEEGDYREIFTTRRTFLNRKLASIYNVPTPAREGFGIHEYSADSPRVGLLGHVSVLALHAHPVSSSATLRGKFVRQTLLCGDIPPPPTNVDTSIPEPSGSTLTLRQRVAEHLENPVCASCHRRMDPIGLALENFDGIGRYRQTENGALIDASGEIDGYKFQNAAELAQVVHDHPDVGACLARKLYRYAIGRVEGYEETEVLRDLSAQFEESGYRVKDLMVAIALSKGFRQTSGPAPAPGQGDEQ